MKPLPFNTLHYKGTHNSYNLLVPPEEQIDDYGVWEVEIDWNVVRDDDGQPLLAVGHDKAGNADSDWDAGGVHWHTKALPASQGDPNYGLDDLKHRFRLAYYLSQINSTLSIKYRPIFLFLEKRPYANEKGGYVQWDGGDEEWDNWRNYFPLLVSNLKDAFRDKLLGPDELQSLCARLGRWPSIPELANRVIPILQIPNESRKWVPSIVVAFPDDAKLVFHDPNGLPINTPNRFPLAESSGPPDHIPSETDLAPYNILRTDWFMGAPTYKYVVPPNPIVIDTNAPDGDPEFGTFKFPFHTIQAALRRARAPVSDYPPLPGIGVSTSEYAWIPEYTGFGWTLLIKSGRIFERVTVDIPATITQN